MKFLKGKGRPKGTGIHTEEGNKERAKQRAILYYSLNFEKNEKENDYNIMQKECCLKWHYLLNFILFGFPFEQLAN